MANRYCTHCGKPLEEGAAVCGVCGVPVNGQAVPPYQQPPYGQQPYQPPYGQPPYQQPPYQQPPYGQPYYGQPMYVSKPPVPGRGFGIASMVLGIFGVLYTLSLPSLLEDVIDTLLAAYNPVPELIGTLLGLAFISVFSILATVFSTIAINKGYRNGVSVSGRVMGIIGLVGSIAFAVACIVTAFI